MFDYVCKNPVKAVLNKFGADGPFDYEAVLGYKSPDELRKLGFGKEDKIGSEKPIEDEPDFDGDFDDGEPKATAKGEGDGFDFTDEPDEL